MVKGEYVEVHQHPNRSQSEQNIPLDFTTLPKTEQTLFVQEPSYLKAANPVQANQFVEIDRSSNDLTAINRHSSNDGTTNNESIIVENETQTKYVVVHEYLRNAKAEKEAKLDGELFL